MKRVTENLYVEDRFSAQPENRGCNPGFVTTSEGIVLLDTPMIPRDAAEWRDKVAKLGEVRYIINTHHHADHMAGNYFFTAPVISSEGVREQCNKILYGVFIPAVVKRSGGRPLTNEETARYDIEDRDPESIPLMKDFRIRLPDITFKDWARLYLGKHTFEMMSTPGHTASHIGVYIPQEKAFFAGDNFTNHVQAVFSSSLPFEWLEQLKKIEAMDVDVVVSGHGKVGNKKDVAEFRQFIETCIDMVRDAMRKGLTKEETADAITFETLLPAVHPGKDQQRLNVMRLYEILSQEPK